MTRKRSRLFPVALLLVLVLIVAAGGAVYYFFFRPAASTVPTVLIHSPRDGTRLDVGQELIVHSSARDDRKVQRVELWVDGKLEHSESSTVPGGTSPFPILARWQPTSPGTHTLTVRAFNAQGGRGHASVNVEAASIADRDRDCVSDAEDTCPDQAGSPATNGCPDRDGDGIADAQDTCPDQAGVAASSGCPGPTVNDRDGDGVVDSSDACPDQAGTVRAGGCPDADGDGVADAADACPGEAGLPERSGCPAPGDTDGDGVADAADACPGDPGPASTGGCPDGDSDGVADREDACPDEAGLPALGGCPDRDGDGVRDSADLCPDVPGPASNGGCPVTGVGDRDGDGIADDVDLCPDEPGSPEHGGCPPPGGGADEDGDGTADDGEVADDSGMDIGPLFFYLFQGYANVEVQALEFQTGHDYDLVHCYVSLAGGETNRYGPFDSLGANYWDIAEHLGGANSARLLVSRGEPLGVDVECGGETVDLGPEEVQAPTMIWVPLRRGTLTRCGMDGSSHRSDRQAETTVTGSRPSTESVPHRVKAQLSRRQCST